VPDEEVRLADLLAALSVATDLAMGQEPEKAIRSCFVAVEMARHMDLAEFEIRDVYYTTLLKHLGCTATTHEETYLFGPDDLAMRPVAERTDVRRPGEVFELLRVTGTGTGVSRLRHVARAVNAGREMNTTIFRAICEVAAMLADRLALGDGVRRALFESLERWDGKGGPQALAGDDIALPARLAEPATQAVIFHRLGGPDAALAMVRRRSGGWFDPRVAEAFEHAGIEALRRLDEADPWLAVLEVEPEPVRRVAQSRLEEVAEAFGDMVDLKTPFTLGHSGGVAELAGTAAEALAISDPRSVRIAALLHDVGRTAVPTGVWEKASALTTTEWEQVRMHAYQTERVLARSEVLGTLARTAGMHHERQDGSGYHRGSPGQEIPAEARVLAAADAYQAMTQDRPHRPARTPEAAVEVLGDEASHGRIDPDAARAVIEAAGQRVTRSSRSAWPEGLTDREVEVLRLVAAGLSNRDIARRLVISPRTAEHHVQNIYAKIGVSTRAGAAMFAMEHALLR
jgi:HD-GYP domain-containing protein (c-di-GMP phosphodiesterase class II)